MYCAVGFVLRVGVRVLVRVRVSASQRLCVSACLCVYAHVAQRPKLEHALFAVLSSFAKAGCAIASCCLRARRFS